MAKRPGAGQPIDVCQRPAIVVERSQQKPSSHTGGAGDGAHTLFEGNVRVKTTPATAARDHASVKGLPIDT
jgi:hypothetical protein